MKDSPRSLIDEASALVKQTRHPVSFSGAGLSAESGIPTFRDIDTDALWARYDPRQLATPEAFARDPKLITEWYNWRRRRIACAEPNAAHLALASEEGWVHVTQNVDDLLERAGARDVIHLHGTIGRNRCSARCGHEEVIDLENPPDLESCSDCGAWMRPDVVWFGEELPTEAWERAMQACTNSGLLLVVGTSAAVYPAAALIPAAKSSSATVIQVNPRPTEASQLADVELVGNAGEILPLLLA